MKPQTWMSAALFIELAALAALSPGLARADDMQDDMHEHMHMHEHAGHDHAAHAMPVPTSLEPASAAVTLSRKPLSDQDGHVLRLKDDVVGDRIVVVGFVYTNCTAVCPVVSSIFSELQAKLGSRLDKDVRLVSMTVDPARDTPSRLKSYAAQYDAKPGWLWLTGSRGNVTEALKGFGAYTANYENHPLIVLIGDGKSGQWSRHYGLSGSEPLLAQVDEFLAARAKLQDKSGDKMAAMRMAADGHF